MTLADPRRPAPTDRTGRHTVPARVRPTAHAATRLAHLAHLVRLAQRLLLDVAAVVGVLCIVALLICLVGGIRPAILVTIPHVGRLLASMQHNLVAVVAALAVLTVLLTVPPGASARSPRRSRAEITTAS